MSESMVNVSTPMATSVESEPEMPPGVDSAEAGVKTGGLDLPGISRREFLAASGVLAASVAARKLVTPRRSFSPSAIAGGKGSIAILDDDTNTVFKNGGIADFERQTGIKVSAYEQISNATLHDRLATMLEAHDDAFDVIMTWAAWAAEFGSAGWLEKLTQSDLPADLLPVALNCVSWGGRIYGFPKFGSIQTMFWDKTMFEQAGLDPEAYPTNYEEFLTAAEKCTAKGHYGYVADMGNSDDGYQNFVRWLLMCGGTMYDAKLNPIFNDSKGVQALTIMVDLMNVKKVMAPSTITIAYSTDLATYFDDKKAAMQFNWPAAWTQGVGKGSELTSKTMGNAIIPGVNVRSASVDGSEGFAINRFSNNKDAALEWLKFVVSPPVQKRVALVDGWLPVSKTILSEPALQASNPVFATYGKESHYQVKRFGSPWYSPIATNISANVVGAMLKKMSPKAALDASASYASSVIAQYRPQ